MLDGGAGHAAKRAGEAIRGIRNRPGRLPGWQAHRLCVDVTWDSLELSLSNLLLRPVVKSQRTSWECFGR